MSIGLLVVMFLYSLTLTLTVVVALVLFGVLRLQQLRRVRRAETSLVGSEAALDTYLVQTLQEMKAIRLDLREMDRKKTWMSLFEGTITNRLKLGHVMVHYDIATRVRIGFEYAAIIYIAANQIADGTLTIGMLYAFILFRTRFVDSTQSLVDRFLDYRVVQLHLARLSEIKARGEKRKSGVHVWFPIRGNLKMDEVTFSYPGTAKRVIERVSFEVPADSFVAVIGPSGSGKSTLLNILAGVLTPTSGCVAVDGRLASDSIVRTFRRSMSMVCQDDSLLEGTVMDNITFFRPDPDEDMAVRVAKLACIHEEISKWPMGYATALDGHLAGLSAGQRQRILLARSLYKEPRLLFLDESTASCESDLQERIFRNLRMVSKTCFFVTHDLDLLEFADYVLRWRTPNRFVVEPARPQGLARA